MSDYYSAKLRQEYHLSQVLAQTGLTDGVYVDNLVALGYYPIVEGSPLEVVFFDPPVEYRVDRSAKVCTRTLTEPVTDVEVVRDRAIEFVWEIGKEDCLDALRGKEAVIETVLFDILAYPKLSGGEGGIRGRVDYWRGLMERVKSAESIDEIREILTEDELFNVPA